MPYKREDTDKCTVNFEYPCYICGYIMSKPKVVIDHVRRIHGYEIPTRHVGHRRPPNPEYDYQNDPKGEYDVQHYSCASCWFHCPETGTAELEEHYLKVHKPKNVDPSKNEDRKPTTPEHYVREMETDENTYETASENEEDDQKPAKKEKSTPQAIDTADIIGRLNELTDLFKSLLK